jgi:homogentisate 1,2-dioxygenase
LLVNKDCTIGLAAPQKSLRDYFYKNADADEMIFIHKGRKLHATMMNIPLSMEITLLSQRELSIKLILIQQSIDCCMSNLSRLFIHQNDTKMNQANT